MHEEPRFTVTEFIDVVNQTLDYAYPTAVVEGEVSELKVSQDKWVFFNLKDENCSLNCFIPRFRLRVPLEDGMKIVVRGRPSLTKWGKFSVTVEQIMPVGEGSIKKAFELLKLKLAKEGLFDPARKRPLPENLVKIGVISSTGAAGYADFCKIINARWGGLEIQTANTQVQGLDAPAQIMRAMRYFNEKSEVQLLVIIRGGGSKDDLSCFNDEDLARAIASSKIPVITGIGHEVDESLADLAADLRGSTPSNVAELITPDKQAVSAKARQYLHSMNTQIASRVVTVSESLIDARSVRSLIFQRFNTVRGRLDCFYAIRPHIFYHVDTVRERLGRFYSVRAQILRTADTVRESLADLDVARAQILRTVDDLYNKIKTTPRELKSKIEIEIERIQIKLTPVSRLDPDLVLKQGYSIVSGKLSPGETIEITTINHQINAKIKSIKERK